MLKHFKEISLLLIFAFALIPVTKGAEVLLPQNVKPGDLFVVKISPIPQKDQKIVIESESGKVQFMGAVQGTPDIQMRTDSIVEIDSKSGSVYELKYLAMSLEGSSFRITDSSGSREIEVKFLKEGSEPNYSWFILAGGIVLLLAGLKLWRYQKSSPNMMSTKSLFMNYEELEKARKMYFDDGDQPGDDKKPETVTSDESVSESQPAVENHDMTGEMLITPEDTLENDSLKHVLTQEKTAQRPNLVETDRSREAEKVSAGEILVVLTGETGQKWEGRGQTVKVGRRRDNQLILTGAEISREHVMFFARAGHIWVKSLTSSNVTRLNGKDLNGEAQIESGSTLNLGGTEFRVSVS